MHLLVILVGLAISFAAPALAQEKEATLPCPTHSCGSRTSTARISGPRKGLINGSIVSLQERFTKQ
jgi:hypothetical protein